MLSMPGGDPADHCGGEKQLFLSEVSEGAASRKEEAALIR